MVTDELSRDYRLLGLDEGADEAEVLAAYQRRRALYDSENLATYNLLTDEARTKLLVDLEAALVRLTAIAPPRVVPEIQPEEVPKHSPPSARRPRPPDGPEPDREQSPGAFLRYHRLAQGISLAEVSLETKIAESRLEAIESEVASGMPAPVYLRGFVVNISRFLGLSDVEELARSYLKKMQNVSG